MAQQVRNNLNRDVDTLTVIHLEPSFPPNSFLVPHSHCHLHWLPTCLESKPSRLCIRTLPHLHHPCPPFTLPPYWFLFSCPVSLFFPLAPSPFITHMKLHALHVDYHHMRTPELGSKHLVVTISNCPSLACLVWFKNFHVMFFSNSEHVCPCCNCILYLV